MKSIFASLFLSLFLFSCSDSALDDSDDDILLPPGNYFTTPNGYTFAYEIYGDRTQPQLLWFNGNGFDEVGVNLPTYLQPLIDENICVIVLDYQTYNQSNFDLNSTLENSADALNYMKVQFPSSAHFIGGNSSGACIALSAANIFGVENDGIFLVQPQFTLNIPKWIGMFQERCNITLDLDYYSQRITDIFGTARPSTQQYESVDFDVLNQNKTFISISNADCYTNPDDIYTIFHSKYHADKILEKTPNGQIIDSYEMVTNYMTSFTENP